MKPYTPEMSRRRFIESSLGAAAAVAVPAILRADSAASAKAARRYCAFIKFLTALDYDQLSDRIAALGFDGVEATVRQNEGYIKPQQAAAELPKLQQALQRNKLELTIVTTDVLSSDQPHAEAVLKAAADAGARRYRLGFYRYDLKKPVVEQIEQVRRRLDGLADLNRRLQLQGMYQNHSGAEMFGATMWDLYYVLRNYPIEQLSCVYDLRHATVEAGEAWPTLHKVMAPHIAAYSVKDFAWSGRRSANVPLGEGQIDPGFYRELTASDFSGPISLHVEYVAGKDPEPHLAALQRDFATLKRWLGAS